MEWLVWILTATALLCGLVGTLVPVLPGLGLIWLAVLFHKLMLPHILSWWTVIFLSGALLIGFLVDWMSGVWGAKWMGSSRYGMAGACVGGVIGLFFGLPGLIIGPLAGALLAELIVSRRGLQASTKAAAGVGLGMVAAGMIRLGLALVMILVFVLNVILS